jgi:hypothetical protein
MAGKTWPGSADPPWKLKGAVVTGRATMFGRSGAFGGLISRGLGGGVL